MIRERIDSPFEPSLGYLSICLTYYFLETAAPYLPVGGQSIVFQACEHYVMSYSFIRTLPTSTLSIIGLILVLLERDGFFSRSPGRDKSPSGTLVAVPVELTQWWRPGSGKQSCEASRAAISGTAKQRGKEKKKWCIRLLSLRRIERQYCRCPSYRNDCVAGLLRWVVK